MVLHTIKRHKTPYVLKLVKIFLVALPIYIILFLIGQQKEVETWFIVLFFALVSFFLGIIIAAISFDYLMDKLIITNFRVVWVNWKSIFKREEHEAELLDIQDIETREKGILSKMKIFNYGFLEIETASAKTCVSFHDCPNPDSVKHFILGQMQKHRGGLHEKEAEAHAEQEWSVN